MHIDAYRGACLVSKGDPRIDFTFANTIHLTAHIRRWCGDGAKRRRAYVLAKLLASPLRRRKRPFRCVVGRRCRGVPRLS